jgi:hypothetical protein
MKTLRSAILAWSHVGRLLPLLILWGIGNGARAEGTSTAHGSCEDLAKAALPAAKILSATSIAAGTFSPSARCRLSVASPRP